MTLELRMGYELVESLAAIKEQNGRLIV